MLLLSSYSPGSVFLSQEVHLVLEHWENMSARSCSTGSSVLFRFTLCVLYCCLYSEEKKNGRKNPAGNLKMFPGFLTGEYVVVWSGSRLAQE